MTLLLYSGTAKIMSRLISKDAIKWQQIANSQVRQLKFSQGSAMTPGKWCSVYVTWNFFCPQILPFWSVGDLRDLLEITDTVNSQISFLWSEGHSWILFLYRDSSSHIIFLQRLNSDKICLSSEMKNFQNQKTNSNANCELPMADSVRLVFCQQHFRPTESLFLWIHTTQKTLMLFSLLSCLSFEYNILNLRISWKEWQH